MSTSLTPLRRARLRAVILLGAFALAGCATTGRESFDSIERAARCEAGELGHCGGVRSGRYGYGPQGSAYDLWDAYRYGSGDLGAWYGVPYPYAGYRYPYSGYRYGGSYRNPYRAPRDGHSPRYDGGRWYDGGRRYGDRRDGDRRWRGHPPALRQPGHWQPRPPASRAPSEGAQPPAAPPRIAPTPPAPPRVGPAPRLPPGRREPGPRPQKP